MGLFRSKQRSEPAEQAPARQVEPSRLVERLHSRWEELLTKPADVVPAQITATLEELELTFEQPRDEMWFVQLGEELWATMAWVEDVAVLGMILMYAEPPAASLQLLLTNSDGGLGWSSVTDDDDGSQIVATRVVLPMDGFDRQSLILGLEAVAREGSNDPEPSELEQRLRARRDPPEDEPPEPWTERTEAQLQGCLAELGLESEPEGGPGRWRIQSDVGPLVLTVHHAGQALSIAHELGQAWDAEDERIGWWLLQLSDHGCRLALAGVGDDGWIVNSMTVLSALPLSAQALAWGIAKTLDQGQLYRASR